VDLRQQPVIRAWSRRIGLRAAFFWAARVLGYDVVKKHYYSEVPDLSRLPSGIWSATSELTGVRFDVEAGVQFVQRELGRFMSEYRPPTAPTGNPREFYLENTFYEALDAEALYAMVRRFNPRRVLELGSGMSTLVIADARARNLLPDGHRHDVYDPYVRSDLRPVLERLAQVHRTSATDVPIEEFTGLRAGDFLFVDTTHTVKIGSDVNRVILDILPKLAPGVFVHFHDIFLPHEYPVEFFTELGFSWAEQYLLQAFLAFNDDFEVLFGASALNRRYPEVMNELAPGAARARRPAAFWIRRVK
jgi:hypothetical protein